jgi:hypothetical protein
MMAKMMIVVVLLLLEHFEELMWVVVAVEQNFSEMMVFDWEVDNVLDVLV